MRSRRRTLSLSVDAFGKLTVRAPLSCADEYIAAFLREKSAWIRRQKERAGHSGVRLPGEELDGYRFLLMGRECVCAFMRGRASASTTGRGRYFCLRKTRGKGWSDG